MGARWLARVEWAVALLVSAVALALYLAFARDAGGLWRDEANSIGVASAPSLGVLWERREFESYPLLWLLLLRGWMALADGDAALRTFGVLGGLTVPAALWFAALRLGRRPPLVGLALVAVNPEFVRCSATVRAWGLATALIVAAFALVRTATAAPTRGRILCAALASLLAAQCAYQDALLLAALAAGAAACAATERRWGRIASLAGIGLVIALTLLPYVPAIVRAREDWVAVQEPTSLAVLAARSQQLPSSAGPIVHACWAVFVVAMLAVGGRRALAAVRGRAGEGGLGLALYALVATLTGTALLAWFYGRLGYPTQPWYYLELAGLVAAAGEAVLADASRGRVARLAVVALTLVVVAAGLAETRRVLREPLTNVDVVAERVGSLARRGDLVLVNPWFLAISFDRYHDGPAEELTVPPVEERVVHRYDLARRKYTDADAMAAFLARVQGVLAAGGRVFVVGGLPAPVAPAPGLVPVPEALWAVNLSALLRDHARELVRIPLECAGGAREDAGLAVARGWRP